MRFTWKNVLITQAATFAGVGLGLIAEHGLHLPSLTLTPANIGMIMGLMIGLEVCKRREKSRSAE